MVDGGAGSPAERLAVGMVGAAAKEEEEVGAAIVGAEVGGVAAEGRRSQ